MSDKPDRTAGWFNIQMTGDRGTPGLTGYYTVKYQNILDDRMVRI